MSGTDFAPGTWVFLPREGVYALVVKALPHALGGGLEVFVEGQGIRWASPEHAEAADRRPQMGLAEVRHHAVKARLLAALGGEALVAPLEGLVRPLPHQIYALAKAIRSGRPRLLMADEVGLGKTVEAGLVIRELALRGEVRRVLVLAPKSLALQWVAEMQVHFRMDFTLVQPGDVDTLGRIASSGNPWARFDRIVVTQDSVKPIRRRAGWDEERVALHNQVRFSDLVTAGWDLVVIDEAHRMAGGQAGVARHELARALARAVPRVLLLTATPHSGKTDGFLRLMQLLSEEDFPNDRSLGTDTVRPFTVRTEKRQAVDMDGRPLFQSRSTRLVAVPWHNDIQRQLYEGVSEYVRTGYNAALRSGQSLLAYLLLLMQRLVSSSTQAVLQTLRQREQALQDHGAGLDPGEDVDEADGEEQRELLVRVRELFERELETVRGLIGLAQHAVDAGVDAKAAALLETIYGLEREFTDPALKVLIFAEFRATQRMLAELLAGRGYPVALLNGDMSLEERVQAQLLFKERARFMIATDAGGEGLNLQFAHVVVNYDLPWNPMRVEQRIGRVDRIGQTRPVVAVNLTLADSVENRVLEVVNEKLQRIRQEFGVDKTNDVLNSSVAGQLVESLYARRILDDADFGREADQVTDLLRQMVAEEQRNERLYGEPEWSVDGASRMLEHRIPYWIEQMVLSALQLRGLDVRHQLGGYRVGSQVLVFDKENRELGELVTLEHPLAREILSQPHSTPEHLRWASAEVPLDVSGVWSLHHLCYGDEQRFVALLDQGGQIFPLAGQRVWESLVQGQVRQVRALEGQPPSLERTYPLLQQAASELRQRHSAQQARRIQRIDQSYQARIEEAARIGIANIRKSRTQALEREWGARRTALEVAPTLELRLVLGLRVNP
ncbi:MAG: helicase-related protein [Meiothermus sp.]|nr:helicase-related protein [Meiothermus sp.]